MAEQLELNRKKHALSGWPMIFAWLGMLIFAFHASTHMVGAGDTWVAMACGRHFINHGVDTVEPFSANSHKAGPTEEEVAKWPGWAQGVVKMVGLERFRKIHPTGWVNQNWLTHAIFYWTTHQSPVADGPADNWQGDPKTWNYKYDSLVYWKMGLYILSVICIYYTGRLLGANPALAAVFACFAMFIGRSFFDIRPAGYSNLLVAVFLLVLVLATYRNILYIWLMVPLIVFWCNLHGGYIYVFIMLTAFFGLHFISIFFPKYFVSIGKRGLIHTFAAGSATLLACLVFNPFHLTNITHTFIISFSKHAEMWREVHEWHPAFAWKNPVGTGFPFLVMLVMFIGLAVFWIFSRFISPTQENIEKNSDLEKQRFGLMTNIFGWPASAFICYVAFLALSFCDAATGLFISILFVGIILLSIRINVHIIYSLILIIPVFLELSSKQKGYAGVYIYPFLILPVFVGIFAVASMVTKKLRYKPINILFVSAAAIGSIVLMFVIVKSFKFISYSDSDGIGSYLMQFIDINKRPWHPVYERNLGHLTRAYNNYLFTVLYVVNLASIVLWLVVPLIKKAWAVVPAGQEEDQGPQYSLAKLDIAQIAIVALTVYMAIKSRRFIPIAGFAACPLMAMFITQMAGTISASFNFHKNGRFVVPSMPKWLTNSFAISGVSAVLVLGTAWGLQYKRVYLDPWPSDTRLTSPFMRMTASYVKPFWVLQFIRENKISGKMFNYWTEGGFIAYGQHPDPETGKTPLQLFMDGRAQAAYEPQAFSNWNMIMAGTRRGAQIVRSARARKRRLTNKEYQTIGKELDKVFKAKDVWVVLMPIGSKSELIIKSLEAHPDWAVAFYNNKQKMLVDTKTEQGESLIVGIGDGSTKFPDEFSRHLTVAHNILSVNKNPQQAKLGLKHAIAAFEAYPCQVAMVEITGVVFKFKDQELTRSAIAFCDMFYKDFTQNKHTYKEQHGYLNYLTSALNAGNLLSRAYSADEDRKNSYLKDMADFKKEATELHSGRMW